MANPRRSMTTDSESQRAGSPQHPNPPAAHAQAMSAEAADRRAGAPAPAAGPVEATGVASTAEMAGTAGTAGGMEPQAVADRVAELEAALAAAKAEAAEHWDKYLRERAEMENYKRRIERTYADLAKQGRKDLYLKVLSALDNLNRALSYEESTGGQVDPKTLITGLRMTYQQFMDALAAEGVKAIEAVGKPFDPSLHEAVAAEHTDDAPEGQIIEELQKGYLYQDELLRPARVKVATRG